MCIVFKHIVKIEPRVYSQVDCRFEHYFSISLPENCESKIL